MAQYYAREDHPEEQVLPRGAGPTAVEVMEELRHFSASLHDRFSKLQEALTPILSPEPATAPGEMPGDLLPVSSITNDLIEVHRTLHRLGTRIDELTGRVNL